MDKIHNEILGMSHSYFSGREVNNQEISEFIEMMKKAYPDARIMLKHKDPLQLLIATILSAQCTDVRVNIVTKDLFKKYKKVSDWACADIKQIQFGVIGHAIPHRAATANLPQTIRIPGLSCHLHFRMFAWLIRRAGYGVKTPAKFA